MFRGAAPGDWPDIYRIFRAVTGSGDTYPYPPGMSEDDARDTWFAPANSVFVATTNNDIVATAYLKANTPGLGDHVANAGWMVDPQHQGRGMGRTFAEYVIDQAKDFGFHGMQFNAVVTTNTKAISLWESLGFEIVGTVPDAFRHSSHGLTPVHIMYRAL